jgi:hypothetical protein
MLGGVKELSEPCMVAGEELGTIGDSDFEH